MISVSSNSNSDNIYLKFISFRNNWAARGVYSFLNNYRVSIYLQLIEINGCLIKPKNFRLVNIAKSDISVFYNGHNYIQNSSSELNVSLDNDTTIVIEGIDGGSFSYEILADSDFATLYKR